MIEVITPELYADYRAELEEMFRLRYRVFKERLGWDVQCHNGMEQDEYDREGPAYLLLRDAEYRVVGTCRLLPTTGRYMLGEVFRELLDGREPPSERTIWEGSRLAVECQLEGERGLSSVNALTREIYCGLVEFGLAIGMTEILTVYDFRVARFLRRIGCHPKWEGKLRRLGDVPCRAVCFDIDRQALENIWDAGEITGSVITAAPWLGPRRAA